MTDVEKNKFLHAQTWFFLKASVWIQVLRGTELGVKQFLQELKRTCKLKALLLKMLRVRDFNEISKAKILQLLNFSNITLW